MFYGDAKLIAKLLFESVAFGHKLVRNNKPSLKSDFRSKPGLSQNSFLEKSLDSWASANVRAVEVISICTKFCFNI